jgi:catechol 2,3-dioxygenase-like lactoylglutathione lyase family enzyme
VAGAKSRARGTRKPAPAGKNAGRSASADRGKKSAPLAAKSAKTATRSTRTKPAGKAPPKRVSVARAAPKPSRAPAKRLTVRRDFAVDRLHQVALLATDLDAAVGFYKDVLGLGFIDRFEPPGLAFFNLGGGMRLLLSATASEATLYFLVEDIDKAVRTLHQRGVSFLQKPAMVHRDDEGRLGKKGVEEWMAFFRDPSGNLLALVAQR